MPTAVNKIPAARQCRAVISNDLIPLNKYSILKTDVEKVNTMGKWTVIGWGWRLRNGCFSKSQAKKRGISGSAAIASSFSVPTWGYLSKTSDS